ncbi:MAG: glycosyltransferase family 4 protein, partial [Actinobacteria bacterium]|nr:glycosyltransferase family 4 protein [Actinomycetota bacterium]
HDPELLSVGVDLKKRGKIVIYDSHEDVPQQILTKPWIPSYLRKLVSLIYSRVEERAVRAFDCVITVNEPIAKRFRALGVPVVILYNYPLLDDIGYADTYIDRSPLICYVGNITKLRGVDRLAEVAKLTGDPLALAGPIDAGDFADLDWLSSPNVTYSGILDREGVSNLYERATVGMVTFLPAPNHYDALPNKLFEYMVAGLPVIVSDFPKWRSMVEDIHCGLVVDPCDTGDIAKAVEYLHGHPEEAREMGLRGRQAVLGRYNWQSEGEKLIGLYAHLSADLDSARKR